MCTESSNQQRMWKDLLGETLRAFLARCIFFFFLKWEKKIHTSSQLQIWLEAYLEFLMSVVVKCFSRQTEQKVMRGAKRLALLEIKKCAARSWQWLQRSLSEWVHAHSFHSPCMLYSDLEPREMRMWNPYQIWVVGLEFLFATSVHDKRWVDRTSEYISALLAELNSPALHSLMESIAQYIADTILDQ